MLAAHTLARTDAPSLLFMRLSKFAFPAHGSEPWAARRATLSWAAGCVRAPGVLLPGVTHALLALGEKKLVWCKKLDAEPAAAAP